MHVSAGLLFNIASPLAGISIQYLNFYIKLPGTNNVTDVIQHQVPVTGRNIEYLMLMEALHFVCSRNVASLNDKIKDGVMPLSSR